MMRMGQVGRKGPRAWRVTSECDTTSRTASRRSPSIVPKSSTPSRSRCATSSSTRLDEARADPRAHVVVLKGNGRAFTAGVDIDDRPDLQDPAANTMHDDMAEISRAADQWMHIWTLPKPVVVKAHGHCVGWGLEIALHADMVLAVARLHILLSVGTQWGGTSRFDHGDLPIGGPVGQASFAHR